MAEDFKQVGDIFKTDSNIVEVGEWVPDSGVPIRITRDDVDEMYHNIDSKIPLTILHGNTPKTIGYAIKFFPSTDGNTIRHEGIVFDSEEFKTRGEAMLREKFLKTGQGRKFLGTVLK